MSKITLNASQKSAAETLRKRMTAGTNQQSGSTIYDGLGNKSITDVSLSTLRKGDKFVIPSLDELKNFLYQVNFNSRTYTCISLPMANGGAKGVYLNSLYKSVPVYNDSSEPTGSAENAGTLGDEDEKKFYNAVMASPTEKEVIELLADHTLEITNTPEVQSARWRDGEIVGVRKVKVPCCKLS